MEMWVSREARVLDGSRAVKILGNETGRTDGEENIEPGREKRPDR